MATRASSSAPEDSVLVGVLKDRRDLSLLIQRRLYRIPASSAPKRPFKYLAFYQPAAFGSEGNRLLFYARICKRHTARRVDLLPEEPHHPRANAEYEVFHLGPIRRLRKPVLNCSANGSPRRVSFGFTSLARLKRARHILSLFGVAHIERRVAEALRKAGIPAAAEFPVSDGKRTRCRLDFAIQCRKGKIALECDGIDDHLRRRQRQRDRIRDSFLKRHGWRVLRLREDQILADLPGCLRRVQRATARLGGAVPRS